MYLVPVVQSSYAHLRADRQKKVMGQVAAGQWWSSFFDDSQAAYFLHLARERIIAVWPRQRTLRPKRCRCSPHACGLPHAGPQYSKYTPTSVHGGIVAHRTVAGDGS